jgi:hypothetical protein
LHGAAVDQCGSRPPVAVMVQQLTAGDRAAAAAAGMAAALDTSGALQKRRV